ncbi:hypothetical protein [Streptomyces cinereoruber]|uniref:hypothetical protein n=1 Tax=Streptomyces cinereoruber TaxID=67260 RepID=UPI0033930DD2
MDFEALHSANFKLLDDTVADWTSMLGRLQALKQDARDGLQGKARKANWAGDNAVIGREFVGKTAGEFGDALTQATSIRNIMRDTRDELKTQQRLLKEAVERGRGKNLTVTANGGGFIVRENPDKKAPGGQSDVNGLRDELQGILNRATEIDTSASTSLKALVDLADHGFSDAVYKDRDSAANAVKEAEKLAALAKKKPEDLTPADFDALNAGLGKYSGDPIFAEHFASTVGAKGTLDLWAGLNDIQKNRDVFPDRHEKYAELQKNLSLTLASATQADTPEMSRWKYDMVNMADQPLSKNSTTFGAQVMSNLMRWGNFDDRFLKDYGSKLIGVEKSSSDNGRHTPMAWTRLGMDPYLNRTGSDSGSDPMIGFLAALAKSPDVATDFFNESFLTKDEDHEFKEDGKKRDLSNFDYLFKERDWPPEVDNEQEDSIEGRNNLARALEAATTGHPAGEMPTHDTLPHNAGQAKLMEGIVKYVSEDSELLTKNGFMSDSMGQIASEYLPDINRAMTNDADKDTDRLFPISGSQATMSHKDVTRFLFLVGQDDEGYAAVEVGQKAYMANLMDYHLNPDLPDKVRYSEDPQFTVEQIAQGSGEVSGVLAQARAEAVAGEAEEKDKAYEHSVAQMKNGISGTVGTITGVGATFIASPVAGEAVGGVSGTVTSMLLEEIFKDAEGKAKDEAGPVMGEHWESGMKSNSMYTEKAAELAAQAHGRADLKDVGEWARRGAQDGFRASGVNVIAMAADLKTDI